MPWWTDPDSLTPPVTPERILDVLMTLFKQDLRQIGPDRWAAAVWHHPVRLCVHDDGPLLHVESLYSAVVVTDIDPLRSHIQATNATHWLSSIRLVPTDTGRRILASSWTPLMIGAEEEQLRSTLGTVIGSTVATNLFGGENPVGQNIRINNQPFKNRRPLNDKGKLRLWAGSG